MTWSHDVRSLDGRTIEKRPLGHFPMNWCLREQRTAGLHSRDAQVRSTIKGQITARWRQEMLREFETGMYTQLYLK